MHKWKIDISLKNGQNISGLYYGSEENSFDVGKQLFSEASIIAIMSLDETAQLFIVVDEISAMGISVLENQLDNQNVV